MIEDPYLAATEALTVNLTVSLGAAAVDVGRARDAADRRGHLAQVQVLGVHREVGLGRGVLVGELGRRGQVPAPPGAEERGRDLLPVLLRGRPGRDHAVGRRARAVVEHLDAHPDARCHHDDHRRRDRDHLAALTRLPLLLRPTAPAVPGTPVARRRNGRRRLLPVRPRAEGPKPALTAALLVVRLLAVAGLLVPLLAVALLLPVPRLLAVALLPLGWLPPALLAVALLPVALLAVALLPLAAAIRLAGRSPAAGRSLAGPEAAAIRPAGRGSAARGPAAPARTSRTTAAPAAPVAPAGPRGGRSSAARALAAGSLGCPCAPCPFDPWVGIAAVGSSPAPLSG